jgi:4-alpha-glucanotransferase
VSPRQDAAVNELASLSGIEPEYYDMWGRKYVTSLKTKKAILTAMGLGDVEARLRERRQRPWNRLLEPVMVVSVNGQPAAIPVHFPLEEGREKDVVLSWKVQDESGGQEGGELRGVNPSAASVLEGARHVRVELPGRTDRDLGYYSLSVTCRTPAGKLSGRMLLAVTPDRCYVPEGRTWGIYVNLYSVRSEGNLGVGDLSDLRELVRWAGAGLCAGFVGISPLHATNNRMPLGISPYSATSRLYRNFIYLDLENLPCTGHIRGLLDSPEFRGEAEALRKSELIDYEAVAYLKKRALRAAFEAFWPDRRANEPFRRFVRREGRSLEDFATFMALEEHLKGQMPQLSRWQDWPEEYRGPGGPAVERFRKAHAREVRFHQFVQWLIEEQLAQVSAAAKEAAMSLGLYKDLAVGSSGDGGDAWSHPEVFAFGVNAGAPPDAFNQSGQNWGFPPLIPERLREDGYRLFIETIRNNLRHAGALRIDHALGLFRLFWIPDGATAKEGSTYVRYPHEELLRIIALESVRNRAAIIAEDLGTLGPEVRETLERFGMLSYRLFYFERDWNTRAFLPPGAYPEVALAAVTTHDLPTLNGYWKGRDIEVKNRLGVYLDEGAWQKDLNDRQADRQLMLDALAGLLPEGLPAEAGSVPELTPGLSLAVHNFLARTPSKLVSVNLDDILFALDQQNLPGVLEGHPNWRQKGLADLGDVLRSEHARALARMFRRESRASGPCNFPQVQI